MLVHNTEYYIESGVRRAVAAREAGVNNVLATVNTPGQAPTQALVGLGQLHSPKPSVSASDPRYQSALQGMQTPQGRAGMPNIQVAPLGGQTGSIPLSQVTLDP